MNEVDLNAEIDRALQIYNTASPHIKERESMRLLGLLAKALVEHEKNPEVFRPHWPDGLKQDERYRVLCDDKGRNGTCRLDVYVANDGDVHVSMQDWEDCPEGEPDPFPSIRVRTHIGGGRNSRTRQALLWLADAIRRDNADNGVEI